MATDTARLLYIDDPLGGVQLMADGTLSIRLNEHPDQAAYIKLTRLQADRLVEALDRYIWEAPRD